MKFLTLSIGFAVAALLTACASEPTPDRALAVRAEQEVSDTMKDPTSVKYKDVMASAKAECIQGQVLAKNSMGGYTGYHSFVWMNGKFAVDSIGDVVGEASAVEFQDFKNFVDLNGKCSKAMGQFQGANAPTIFADG